MAIPVLGLPGMAVPTGVANGLPVACRSSDRAFAKTSALPPPKPSRRVSRASRRSTLGTELRQVGTYCRRTDGATIVRVRASQAASPAALFRSG